MLTVLYKTLIKKIVFVKSWYFVNISVFPLYFGSFQQLFKNVLRITVSFDTFPSHPPQVLTRNTRSPETMFKVKIGAFFLLQKVMTARKKSHYGKIYYSSIVPRSAAIG